MCVVVTSLELPNEVAGTSDVVAVEMESSVVLVSALVVEVWLVTVDEVAPVADAVVAVATVVPAWIANPVTRPIVASTLPVREAVRARAAGCRRLRDFAVVFMAKTLPHRPGVPLRTR